MILIPDLRLFRCETIFRSRFDPRGGRPALKVYISLLGDIGRVRARPYHPPSPSSTLDPPHHAHLPSYSYSLLILLHIYRPRRDWNRYYLRLSPIDAPSIYHQVNL